MLYLIPRWHLAYVTVGMHLFVFTRYYCPENDSYIIFRVFLYQKYINIQKSCPHNILTQGGEFEMANSEKIRIKIKGYEHSVVDLAASKVVEAAKRSGARVSGPIPLPTDKEVVTILRAVHKYKDSREQFEQRTHKRLIDIIRPTDKTLESIQSLEIPAGVSIDAVELK